MQKEGDELRTAFNIIRADFVKWLRSDKQLVTAFAFICFYMYVLDPISICSDNLGEPINLLEPFLVILGNGFCIPIVLIAFVVLMIDFPDISGNTTFLLLRSGRMKWYRSQILFITLASIIFILAIFIFSSLASMSNAFLANVWSNEAKLMSSPQYEELRIEYPLAVLDMSVINNYSIITAFIYAVVLMILHLIFTAQLQMVLSLRFNKIIGICGNLIVLGFGLVLWAAENNLKWLFPFANSTIGWHYDELYNKTEFPILLSLIYMIIINIIMYFAGKKVISKKMLTLLCQN